MLCHRISILPIIPLSVVFWIGRKGKMPAYVIGNFLIFSIINAFTLGPGNILALNTVTNYGYRNGRPLFLGIFTGYYVVQILCAVFVLSAVWCACFCGWSITKNIFADLGKVFSRQNCSPIIAIASHFMSLSVC